MIGRPAVVVVLAAASLAAAPARQVFRATVDAVRIDVSVRQGSRLVSDLTAADFSLLDNEVPQAVRVSDVEKLPIDVSLLLDTSGSVEGRALDALKNAVRDAAHVLLPTDRIRLITFADTIGEVFPFQAAGTALPLDKVTAGGATVLYDALAATLMQARPPDRRSLVIAFTDGSDTRSFLDAEAVRAVALRADAVLQMVIGSPPGRVVMGPVTSARTIVLAVPSIQTPIDPRLSAIATATGGGVTRFDLRSSLSEVFSRLIAEFRTSYVLVYTPAGVRHEGWHDVKVTVTRRGTFEVHARQGYDGGPPAPAPASGRR